jgi:hypothetical protein
MPEKLHAYLTWLLTVASHAMHWIASTMADAWQHLATLPAHLSSWYFQLLLFPIISVTITVLYAFYSRYIFRHGKRITEL